jgi:vancomycin resistance protein YoaR
MAAAKKRKRKKKKKVLYRKMLLGFSTFLIVFITGLLILKTTDRVRTAKAEEPVVIEIDGEDVSDLTQEKAVDRLMRKYPWNMTVAYGEKTYPVDDRITPIIKQTVADAFEEAAKERERLDSKTFWNRFWQAGGLESVNVKYDLEFGDIKDIAADMAVKVADASNFEPEDSTLTEYDAENGKFVVAPAKDGVEIDKDKLAADIREAFEKGDYEETIMAEGTPIKPQLTADAYKTMGSYTTKTTANENRNTNVRLAAQAINGRIIQPGEQFSFNTVVGQRTEEKGYKTAPAYSDGQTVQEYGGGVCQVSSTLYNAVIAAGLDADQRRGHSYEPSYVTPGQDATVSYQQPDFAFTNTTAHPIGIKASYYDRTVYVELFGVPILEEGVKCYMDSSKLSDIETVPTYVEDPTVPFGQEVVDQSGSNGSVWTTDIVKVKDGKEIERTFLHKTTYKGHEIVIRRNTTVPTITPPPPAPAPEVQPEAQPQEQKPEKKKEKKKEEKKQDSTQEAANAETAQVQQ